MAGVGAGEARLTLEAGSSRFVTTVRIARGPVSASTMREALPAAVASIERQLERIQSREEQTQ
ncbi:hypothetical protein EDM22_12280 [Agromyces tardus]|uniref:Uncharacterized protein n=1 Tax=Agromyces tardus TaxID=2583849 RepID=A0A3M8A8P1_9MICO|nr:HPF/RaiA family ribosome-associated protein [Agromyces tardus]RNB47401.1 hypothetical protein EDM22_12280 [Agromyces tardus]